MYKDRIEQKNDLLSFISRILKHEKFLVVALTVVVLSITTLSLQNSDIISTVSTSYYVGIPLLFVILSIWKTKNLGIRTENGKKLLIFAAFAGLRALGEITRIVYERVLEIEPFPSVADVFWLSAYPVLFVFLMLNSIPIKLIPKKTVFLSAAITFGFFLPSLLFAIGNVAGLGLSEMLLTLAYTIGDVSIIFLLIPLIVHTYGLKSNTFFNRQLIGILLFLVSDTLFVIQAYSYQSGNLSDLGWFCGYIFFCSAILKSKSIKFTELKSFSVIEDLRIKRKAVVSFVAPLVTTMLIFTIFVLNLDFYSGHLIGITKNEMEVHGISLALISIIAILQFSMGLYASKIVDLIEIKDAVIKDQYKELNFTNQQLSQIMTALDDASLVSLTDREGNIIYTNKKFCDVSKYTKEELLGQNHRILKSGYHPPEFYSNIWKTITSGKVWHGVIKNKAKDGTFYWVKSTISPILDEKGTPVRYASVRTDITEQIELQERLVKAEKLSAIGELAARLAHDIRNPLSVIKNAVSLIRLKSSDSDKETAQHHKRLDNAIARITHQVDEVLDFIKPRPLLLETHSICGIFRNVTERMTIPEKVKINLLMEDVRISCDSEKLEIVFVNLITNAVQAMNNEGQIDIKILDEGKDVLIIVKDNGRGIPVEFLPKIFEPLFTTKQTGTGLGLATCKSVIERHGGSIAARNDADKGAIFTIRLPKGEREQNV